MTEYENAPEHLQGETNEQFKKYLKTAIKYAGLAMLSVAAFAFSSFFVMPLVVTAIINAWFAGSMVYLAGLAYGIGNDIIACRQNLPYFIFGHQRGQRGIIKSNGPTANAIAWGIVATFGLALIAAIFFIIPTLIMGLVGLPFAGFILPMMGAALPLVIGAAHWFGKKGGGGQIKETQESLSQKGCDPNNKSNCIEAGFNLDSWQKKKLKHHLKDINDCESWMSNGYRNGFGYASMPLLGLLSLGSIIACSAAAYALPGILFSAAFSVFAPLGLGILLAVGISAACLYLYATHDKRFSDKPYQLVYPDDSDEEIKRIVGEENKKELANQQKKEVGLSSSSNSHKNMAVLMPFSSTPSSRQPHSDSIALSDKTNQQNGTGSRPDEPVQSDLSREQVNSKVSLGR